MSCPDPTPVKPQHEHQTPKHAQGEPKPLDVSPVWYIKESTQRLAAEVKSQLDKLHEHRERQTLILDEIDDGIRYLEKFLRRIDAPDQDERDN